MAKTASTHSKEQTADRSGATIVSSSDQERHELVTRKVTCPFLGPLVAGGNLPVRQDMKRPLASIEEVRQLGNSGSGDLGDVLVIFAQGNHALMAGPSGVLDQEVPQGLFSLDLPGSQGSHPGHSRILQGDPDVVNSGRFSESDFNRLISRATNGQLKRSEVGAFIKENVERDMKAEKFSIREFVKGTLSTVAAVPPAAVELLKSHVGGKQEHDDLRELLEALTSNARASNLVGSAGEFGLLFAFLENRPGAVTVDGEPAVSVADLTLMFKDKTLPAGWDRWKKTKSSWVKNTLALAKSATAAHSSK